MAYAAGIQSLIYSKGPCYQFPLKCPEAIKGTVPNRVSVLLQLPAYVLLSIGEILFYATGLEHAYANAPHSMKSIVVSLFMITEAGGCMLGIAVSPASKDPWLVILYSSLAGALAVVSVCLCLGQRRKASSMTE